MLISPDCRFVVSHLGWVDKSSLWTYDVVKDSINLASLGNAKYLSLYPCKDPNQFAVLHHFDGRLIRLTLHTFDNPAAPLCAIEHSSGESRVEGNVDVLQNVPRFYTAFYNPGSNADYHLISIDSTHSKIEVERFDWYDNSYDKDYQGIVGVIELPSGELIISVQRDSNPIVYDPGTKTVLRKLSLAGKYGNPKFRFAKHRQEIWADDYDTILKFDPDTLNKKASRGLQMMLQGTSQFIGDWSFNSEESLCLVSRPFSGDLVAISTEDLKTKYVAQTGKQPLEAIFLRDETVIGRDWKTGVLLKGALKRKWLG
jgi:hypothetical protein